MVETSSLTLKILFLNNLEFLLSTSNWNVLSFFLFLFSLFLFLFFFLSLSLSLSLLLVVVRTIDAVLYLNGFRSDLLLDKQTVRCKCPMFDLL